MARKRQKIQHLDYHSPEYWEKLLTDEGLSMERGRSTRISYVGGSTSLESIEAAIATGNHDKTKDLVPDK